MVKRVLVRLFISILGIGFIYMGLSGIWLGYAGQSATAVVTSIRREGGERSDAVPGRYTYSIGYTFSLPDGQEASGFAKHIGDSVYVKPTGTFTLPVRYFSFCPQINALERDTGLRAGPLLLMATGIFLILVINKIAITDVSDQQSESP